jgi:hypothetical protein
MYLRRNYVKTCEHEFPAFFRLKIGESWYDIKPEFTALTTGRKKKLLRRINNFRAVRLPALSADDQDYIKGIRFDNEILHFFSLIKFQITKKLREIYRVNIEVFLKRNAS